MCTTPIKPQQHHVGSCGMCPPGLGGQVLCEKLPASMFLCHRACLPGQPHKSCSVSALICGPLQLLCAHRLRLYLMRPRRTDRHRRKGTVSEGSYMQAATGAGHGHMMCCSTGRSGQDVEVAMM